MEDPNISLWKMQGHLHLWRYEPRVKNMEGWHLNADPTACAALVDLIDRMSAHGPTRKRISTSVPTHMRFAPGHPWTPVAELILRYSGHEVADDYWRLELTAPNVLTLTVGTTCLQELRQALLNLPHGNDDFALGPQVDWKRQGNRAERERFTSERLWFWTKIE